MFVCVSVCFSILLCTFPDSSNLGASPSMPRPAQHIGKTAVKFESAFFSVLPTICGQDNVVPMFFAPVRLPQHVCENVGCEQGSAPPPPFSRPGQAEKKTATICVYLYIYIYRRYRQYMYYIFHNSKYIYIIDIYIYV